ncbi:zinc-ribbon domain-containing protein [Maribacter sp. 2308TA10-17]|uniref:zinc-ribbon domain-containing protein n=1 Tax=Maribacter sp. 2308TA10-17 TaxID=3386276 RepID=UPI0039BD0481
MIFFFGSRASKIKERKLKRTTCPHCETKDSFTVSTFSKYFHFFFIPIIPLFKTHVAECSHCRKSYSKHEFTKDMNAALDRENETNPAKRPIWQGCGCMLITGFFLIVFSISIYGVYFGDDLRNESALEKDARKDYLDADFKKTTAIMTGEKASLTLALKECVDYDIESGLNTDKIQYFTRINEQKLLVLLRIRNIKEVEPSDRKIVINVVEDCLAAMPALDSISEYYIGVEGKWNTVLVKTPTDSDLGGRFADKYKLLPFYGEKEIARDSTEIKEIIEAKSDSIPID